MSAFICSDSHIVRFVVGCHRLRRTPLTQEDLQAQANLLLAANIRSVNYRYNEHTKLTSVKFESVDVDLASEYTAADLVALGTCIEYQSCEHPKWETSKAHHLLMTLMNLAYYQVVDKRQIKSTLWSI